MSFRDGLSWKWSRCALGVVFAAPAAVVALVSPPLGLALAIGVLPAAAFGLPATRRARGLIPMVGLLTAAGLLVGSVLTQVPFVAVPGIGMLSVGAALLARRGRFGQLVLALVLPLTGIGLSFSHVGVTAAMAGLIVAGSVYAWAVSLLWPEKSLAIAPMPPQLPARQMLVYGVLLALAARIAAAAGYVLGLEHVGWATGAALLVMRPVRAQLVMRSIGRAISVSLGALVAAAVAAADVGPVGTALVAVVSLSALAATQTSRWYVAPGFTTLLALTLILSTSAAAPRERFVERIGETVLGVGLALLFGAVVPWLWERLAARRA